MSLAGITTGQRPLAGESTMRIIAGAYKGRSLKSTTGPGFRPAMGKVREALFSILEARGVHWPATRVLDLFAGSGSLGFEALSRGAATVCFVESAPYAAKVINANAELLGVEPERISILREDALKALARRPLQSYGVIFIDPPYKSVVLCAVLDALLSKGWASDEAFINAEVEARQPFEAQAVHSGLELLSDRAYGQTRVLLWTRS
ncbi:16S rRNA (guanine(966)-N(2))-methyltransferase RsmD [Desulfovibrio sp. OttesenSCG-928-A18]|nr:16S rRNA (guanine(966)-N(2))-methyltransferase RsmD [Desulfovibrio sp. OttesenSCG-928-A18]